MNRLSVKFLFSRLERSVAFWLHLYMCRAKCRKMFEACKIRPVRGKLSALPRSLRKSQTISFEYPNIVDSGKGITNIRHPPNPAPPLGGRQKRPLRDIHIGSVLPRFATDRHQSLHVDAYHPPESLPAGRTTLLRTPYLRGGSMTEPHIDFDRSRLRPLLDSGCSFFQLVSYEWERVDGALITAALRMNRTLYKWSGARRLQVWNNDAARFDVFRKR